MVSSPNTQSERNRSGTARDPESLPGASLRSLIIYRNDLTYLRSAGREACADIGRREHASTLQTICRTCFSLFLSCSHFDLAVSL